MTSKLEPDADPGDTAPEAKPAQRAAALQRALGWAGVVIAAPFFVWAPLGFFDAVPSMVDAFGVVGLRIPASITIGGLLLAAIGFHKF